MSHYSEAKTMLRDPSIQKIKYGNITNPFDFELTSNLNHSNVGSTRKIGFINPKSGNLTGAVTGQTSGIFQNASINNSGALV